jgi:cytoskeletal protein RodZ
LIISGLPDDITNEVYSSVGKLITYKWLINIILILILGIILIIYHYRNSAKREIKEILESQKVLTDSTIPKEEEELDPKEIEETYKYILKNLSKDEKELLREFMDNDTKTRSFSLRNGVAMGLKSYNVLYISSNITRGLKLMVPFNIQPWAWEMLKENPKYLK